MVTIKSANVKSECAIGIGEKSTIENKNFNQGDSKNYRGIYMVDIKG